MYHTRFFTTLFFICFFQTSALALTIPAPALIPDDTSLVTLYIPNLATAIERLQQTTEAFYPQGSRDAVVSGIGTILNDPQLKQLGTGPSILLISPGIPMPSFSIILPSLQPELYAKALTRYGLINKIVDGHIIASKTPDGLDQGEQFLNHLDEMDSVPLQGEMRLLIDIDRIMSNYGSFMTNMALMASAMGGKKPELQAFAKLTPLFCAILHIVGKDIDIHQMDFRFTPEALSITSTTAAITDSMLADALVAPKNILHASSIHLGTNRGAILLSMCQPYSKWAEYATTVFTELDKRPDSKALVSKEFSSLITHMASAYTGDMAMCLRPGTSDSPIFITDSVLQITNVKEAIDAQFQMFDLLFGAGTAIGNLYKSMGVTVTITKDARRIGTLPIHSFSMSVDDDHAALSKQFSSHSEFAATNGFFVMTQGKPLEELLHAGPQAPFFVSRNVHGLGHMGYCDFNPSLYALAIMRAQPHVSDDLINQLKKLPTDHPCTAVIDCDSGRMRSEIRLPTKPFAALGTLLFDEMLKEKEQNADEDPAPVDNKPKSGAALF